MFFSVRYNTKYLYILLVFAGVLWLNIFILANWCFQPDAATSTNSDDPSLRKLLAQNKKRLQRVTMSLRRRFGSDVADSLLFEDDNLPRIYVVTPTHTRPEQKAELTVLAQTFTAVARLHWIVVEDAPARTALVARLLAASGLAYTHLAVATPPAVKLSGASPRWSKPRGVAQRNAALYWLRSHLQRLAEKSPSGVLYFADDDNTYDWRLFEQMRDTRRLSVWPVGLVGKLWYEAPVVNDAGSVVGWRTAFQRTRPFGLDMAGFAVHVALLLENENARFSETAAMGQQESTFLSALGLTMADAEPKADRCTKVLVWHTRTMKPELKQEEKLAAHGMPYDPSIEV